VRSPVLIAVQPESVSGPRALPSVLDQVVFYGVFGVLLFAPLAFGTTEPWSVFVLESASAALGVIWLFRQVMTGELQIRGNAEFLPMAAFAALVAVQLFTGRTSYRHDTIAQAMLYAAYGILCFLVIQVLRRTSQVRALAEIFTLYGFGVALFGLVQGIDPNGKLYWMRRPHLGGWIYGPYVNHNHYAGLMEMLLPISLVVALGDVLEGPRKTVAGIAAAVMACTIFLSGSRGGMLAFAVEMAILGAIVIRRRRSRKFALTLGLIFVLSGGLIAWLGGGQLTKRLAALHADTRMELEGGTRVNINRDGLKMFQSKPWLGWGLGVFPTVYPQYRTFYTNFFVNEAHDDYLQLLVEMGGLGFVTMLCFLSIAYYRSIRKLHDWPKEPNAAVALAAMLGITGILVHSFVDFNLQIPANAALFYVLCVVAAMKPQFAPFHRARQRHRPEIPGTLSA